MLNRVVIAGRLGSDPELRTTQSGVEVCSVNLAVDRDFKDKETGERGVDWIPVVAWRGTATFLNQFFSKGRVAIVDGRLQVREWEDDDGNKRRITEVVADTIYFGDSKNEGNSTGGNTGKPKPAASKKAAPVPAPVDEDESDDSLPF